MDWACEAGLPEPRSCCNRACHTTTNARQPSRGPARESSHAKPYSFMIVETLTHLQLPHTLWPPTNRTYVADMVAAEDRGKTPCDLEACGCCLWPGRCMEAIFKCGYKLWMWGSPVKEQPSPSCACHEPVLPQPPHVFFFVCAERHHV